MHQYLPKGRAPGARELLERARDALVPQSPPDPPAPRGPGISAWYLISGVAADHDVRVMDTATRFAHHITVRDVAVLAYPELMVPVAPMIQNRSIADSIEIVFSPNAVFGDGIEIPARMQWTPDGLSDMGSGGAVLAVDVIDRVARLLGHVAVDSLPAGGIDVSDRAARLLGVVASITAAIDVSDRAARLLGHVAVDSLPAGGIDVSDRSARLLGLLEGYTRKKTYATNSDPFSFLFGAGGIKQWGGLARSPASATLGKIVRISLDLLSVSGATILKCYLQRLNMTTVPAGFIGLNNVPFDTGDPAVSVMVPFLNPTTAGSVDVPGLSRQVQFTAAGVHTDIDTSAGARLDLYRWDSKQNTKPLTIRANVAEGWAIQLQSSTAVTIGAQFEIEWTEE